ncbi:hypothetical protein RvY_17736 [Ramazzottius varieornatus]|uniref:Uncharacterized protein n=1 Tax=Ramazzottius varieornatus TaxID=947166 RepID=A0A1D1W592_RAMVA|nr:hypothetical protein RvY_17736 [Ramazzottius varieornatus]
MAKQTVEIRFAAWKQAPLLAELFHAKKDCDLILVPALISEASVLGDASNALEQLFKSGDTIQSEEIQCHSLLILNYSELVRSLVQNGKSRKRRLVVEATGAVSEGSGYIVDIPDIRYDMLSLWIQAMYTGLAEVEQDQLQVFLAAGKILKVEYTAFLAIADSVTGVNATSHPDLSPVFYLDLIKFLSDASRAEKSKVANPDATKRHDQLNLAAKWVAIEFLRLVSEGGDVEAALKQYLPSVIDRHWWHMLYVMQGKSDLLRGTKYLVNDVGERRFFTTKDEAKDTAKKNDEEKPLSFSVWRFQIVKMFTLWEKEYQEHLDDTPLRKFCYDMIQKISLTEVERITVVVLHFEHKDLSRHGQWLLPLKSVMEAKTAPSSTAKPEEVVTPRKAPAEPEKVAVITVASPMMLPNQARDGSAEIGSGIGFHTTLSKKPRPSPAERAESEEFQPMSTTMSKKRAGSARADKKRGRK